MNTLGFTLGDMDLSVANLLEITGILILPALVVMGLLVWRIKRQHDPMVLDRRREREARGRRRNGPR